MKDTDLAYFAGILDGEGHVRVDHHAVVFVLCMADLPILDWCHVTFGGTLSNGWKAERGAARPRKMWHLTETRGLEAVARAVLPYLVLKRREVEILIEAIEHRHVRPRNPHGPEGAKWREDRGVIQARLKAAMHARK